MTSISAARASITISRAAPADHRDIAGLYLDAGYRAAIEQADTILVAKSGGRLAAVVRLCLEEGVTVLRGMQVRPAFQRQGVGSALLAACTPWLEVRQAYCLPYAHLAAFYATAGFQAVGAAQLPPFLAQRLAAYRKIGHDVIGMRRTLA